jgi:hypothetical protein
MQKGNLMPEIIRVGGSSKMMGVWASERERERM